jgi:hypothetical protein
MKTTRLRLAMAVLLFCRAASSQLLAATAVDSPTFHDWKMYRDLKTVAAIEERSDEASYVGNATRITGGGISGQISTLNYLTGGEANVFDADALTSAQTQRAPDRLVEKERNGNVEVRLWAFKGQHVERGKDLVRRTAKALHLATTKVMPGRPISILADIYVMPKGIAYSLARNVQWKTGRPLEVVISIPDGEGESRRDTATHELFHVLAVQQRQRQWYDSRQKRPIAATAYGEIAANLFASCGALLADGYLMRPRANPELSYVINDVTMQLPLTSAQVKQVVATLRVIDSKTKDGKLGNTLGYLLESTPVLHVFESGQDRIVLRSLQGEQLIGKCRDLLPDPMSIELWLEGL